VTSPFDQKTQHRRTLFTTLLLLLLLLCAVHHAPLCAADMTVLGDLTHLRTLPTDFAWVPHQAPYKWIWNKGTKDSLLPAVQLPIMGAFTD
jgi:hypothetical protein